MRPYVIGITGASGVLYAVNLVKTMTRLGFPVHLIISDAARLVFHEELGISLKNSTQPEVLAEVFGKEAIPYIQASLPANFLSPVASGSYPTQGMVIVPCSMGSLGAIASGNGHNLIHRAADCILKEGRRLVIVPRETPLNAIHLENMLKLSRLGARIVPAMPGFYSGADQIKDLVDFMTGKILDQFNIEHTLYPRWTGSLQVSHTNKDNG